MTTTAPPEKEKPGWGPGAYQNQHAYYGTGTGLASPLLARLDGVRVAGPGRWFARCPAHDDNTPSLSVREDGERVLIHCFTGCTADDVLTAVGLQWKDLYPDRWDRARLRPNEGAARYLKKAAAALDPMDIERAVLRVAAADIRAGRTLSLEDQARVEVARERVAASLEVTP